MTEQYQQVSLKTQKVEGKAGLIIDDDVFIVDMLSKFFKTEGYLIDVLCDGKLALERIDGASYDFILCDIKMPGMDGITLYQKLLERKYLNLDKIVFISGDTISDYIQDFLKSVKNPVLSKPFDLVEAQKIIEQLLT